MGAVMNPKVITEISQRYQALADLVPLRAISTKKQYDDTVSIVNSLLDVGAADEKSPLAGVVDLLSAAISEYEDVHYPAPSVAPGQTLKFLMQQHRLSQSDLPEIGSQGVVSELLSGKRELNVRQIRELSARFHVPATVFI